MLGGVEQLMESNPEFAQILNNPQMLRESLQVASNPVCPLLPTSVAEPLA